MNHPTATDSSPPGKSRTLIWHIGWPKTGTTSIQNFFKHNQRRLLRECGVLYPSTGLKGPGHFTLGRSLQADRPPDPDLWQRLGDELEMVEGWRQALISAEGLHAADLARLRELAACLGADNRQIRVVAYVRPPDEMIESMFAQHLKTGAWTGTFAGYASREQAVRLVDYAGDVEAWQSLFPGAAVAVRPFHRKCWVNGDLIEDFCHAAGLEHVFRVEFLRVPNAVNRSPGRGMLSLLREINRQLAGQRDPSTAWGFGQLLDDLEARPCPAVADSGKARFFGPAERGELRARAEPGFRRLGVEFPPTEGSAADSPGGELGEFNDLPAGQREQLLRHTLETAVLTLDRVCAKLEDAQVRCDRLASENLRQRQRHEDLAGRHRDLVRRHREVSRQYHKTWRCRVVELRSRWREWRKGRAAS